MARPSLASSPMSWKISAFAPTSTRGSARQEEDPRLRLQPRATTTFLLVPTRESLTMRRMEGACGCPTSRSRGALYAALLPQVKKPRLAGNLAR